MSFHYLHEQNPQCFLSQAAGWLTEKNFIKRQFSARAGVCLQPATALILVSIFSTPLFRSGLILPFHWNLGEIVIVVVPVMIPETGMDNDLIRSNHRQRLNVAYRLDINKKPTFSSIRQFKQRMTYEQEWTASHPDNCLALFLVLAWHLLSPFSSVAAL